MTSGASTFTGAVLMGSRVGLPTTITTTDRGPDRIPEPGHVGRIVQDQERPAL